MWLCWRGGGWDDSSRRPVGVQAELSPLCHRPRCGGYDRKPAPPAVSISKVSTSFQAPVAPENSRDCRSHFRTAMGPVPSQYYS